MRSFTVAVVLTTAGLSRAERVNDSEHGFSFEPPIGFAATPATPGSKTLHTYGRGTLGEPQFQVFGFEPLGATLGEGTKLNPKLVESAARKTATAAGMTVGDFTYEKVTWKTHRLDLLTSKMSRDGIEIITYATQVPLAHGAMQLATAGHTADARATHLQVLASIQGRSNWRSEDEKLGFMVGRVVGLALCPLLLIGVGVTVLLLAVRRRRAAKPPA